MAGDVAATIARVMKKLSEVATEEALLHVRLREDVSILDNKLAWLRTSLEGVTERSRDGRNQIEALWIEQAVGVLFDAEDTLDDFSSLAVQKASRVSSTGKHWKALLKFQCFGQILVNHKFLKRIEALKVKLEELDNQKSINQIQFDPLPWQFPAIRQTSPKWDGTDSYEPVGSELHVHELNDQLLNGEKKRIVISIIGSGNGTSSFVKKVYDSAEIKNHFEVAVWTNLPLKFSLNEVFSELYCKVEEQIDQDEVDSCKREDDGEALYALLRKGRYLIVLNGIASQDDWEEMSNFLPDEENSSRVLLIPKHKSDVAILSESEDIVSIRPAVALSLHDSSELFSQTVFGNRTEYPVEFGVFMPKVHAATKGDPWSILLLAYLLKTKLSSKLWKKVFNYLDSSTARNPVDRLLPLTFDSLPHQLKSCFLYFAAMPESAGFEADQLVRIWIAEGFIELRYRKTPEEIGEGYLKELVSRSLVQVLERDEFGGIAVVAVNDRIRAFLQSVAHGSCFVTVCDNANLVSSTTVRRLAIQNYVSKYVQVKNSFPKLRSFMCDCLEQHSEYRPHHTMKFLLESKYLRVIDLHGLIIKNLPKAIGRLIHLRYLGIHCGGLRNLPSSIGELQNLQTFDIRKTPVETLPESFWGIEALRHVIADTVKLPKQGRRVVVLSNLQTLRTADCTYWNHQRYQLMEKIWNIRSLSLEQLTTSQAKEISSSLGNLLFLRYLSLKAKDANVLPSSVFTEPVILRCLEILELHGMLDRTEEDEDDNEGSGARMNELSTMPKLVSLTLTMSQIDQQFMDMLSRITSLERLSLYKAYNGRTIRFLRDGFRNLRELELSCLADLKEWIEVDSAGGALPKLRKVTLSGCTKLRKLPEGVQGLQLEEVRIYNMDKLITEIRNKQGENFEKIKEVKIIKTRIGG